jgi:hypothetical protein
VAKRSNKQMAEILASRDDITKEDPEVNRKISLANEGFTNRYCELVLRDRNRLSKENALTISEYIIAMKREINPRLNTIRTTIQFLNEISRCVGISKKFNQMTKEDILLYLDSCRKSESDDPLHKWIGTYNSRRVILFRFFKWLYYQNVANSNERNELSKS